MYMYTTALCSGQKHMCNLPEATPLVVTRSLIVKQGHSWVLHVNGHLVDQQMCHLFNPFLPP